MLFCTVVLNPLASGRSLKVYSVNSVVYSWHAPLVGRVLKDTSCLFMAPCTCLLSILNHSASFHTAAEVSQTRGRRDPSVVASNPALHGMLVGLLIVVPGAWSPSLQMSSDIKKSSSESLKLGCLVCRCLGTSLTTGTGWTSLLCGEHAATWTSMTTTRLS